MAQTTSAEVLEIAAELKPWYKESLEKAQKIVPDIVDSLPEQWSIPKDIVLVKLQELFTGVWIGSVWENFIENIKDNI